MITKLLLSLLIITSSLYAGSGPAFISGKTSSGRTAIEISVEDMSGTINSVKLTVDGKSLEMKSSDNATQQTIISDVKNGVYVLVLKSDSQVFKLWMIPGTNKITKQTDGSYHSTFAAIIEATDPRENNGWKLTPRITIGCTLKYDI